MLRRSQHLFGAAAVPAAMGPMTAGDSYDSQRECMVREQIEGRGIRHPDVLRVLRVTPRHVFVPEVLRGMAYDDCAVPIGFGATISQPYVVALMTELLRPEKWHRVLEIGTGSGYQAAVLAQLTNQVDTIEITPQLAEATRQRLAWAIPTSRCARATGIKGGPRKRRSTGLSSRRRPRKCPKHSSINWLQAAGWLLPWVPSGVRN